MKVEETERRVVDGEALDVVFAYEPCARTGVTWVDFVAYAPFGYADDAEKTLYQRRGAEVSPAPVEGLADAEPVFSGYIKWDGCNELELGEWSGHACGIDGRAELHRSIEAVLARAAEKMGESFSEEEAPDAGVWERI